MKYLLTAFFLLVSFALINAQADAGTMPAANNDTTAIANNANTSESLNAVSKNEDDNPKIINVYGLRGGATDSISFNEYLRIELSSWGNLSTNPENIILYVNHFPMKDLHPYSVNPVTNEAFFFLDRDKFIDEILPSVEHRIVPLKIGLGEDSGTYIRPDSHNIFLITYETSSLLLGLAIILGMIIALILLGRKSNLLRNSSDFSYNLDWSKLPKASQPGYSLAKTQLAWWTFIIVSSFIFLAVVRHELIMTSQALILMGISAATTTASSVVDQSKNLTQAGSRMGHQSFIMDIIRDANGVSIVRFQNAVFNLILGGIFIKSVFSELKMPEFDSNMLILMGISSGTYTGMKSVEKNAPPEEAAVVVPEQPAENKNENIAG